MIRATPTLRAFLLLLLGSSLALFLVDQELFANLGIASPPVASRLIVEVWNLSHLLYFAGLTLCSLCFPRLTQQGFWRWLFRLVIITALAGGAIELLQLATGRTASLADFQQDLTGTLLAASLLGKAFFRLSGRPLLLLRLAALAALVIALTPLGKVLLDDYRARQQFPLLSGFETSLEALRWDAGSISSRQQRKGGHSLEVVLAPGLYAGPAMVHALGDWSPYRSLHFSLLNPSGRLRQLHVKIRDVQNWKQGSRYRDAFNRVFRINPGWNDISVSLHEVRHAPQGRAMQMRDLLSLSLFFMDLPREEIIYLDELYLSR